MNAKQVHDRLLEAGQGGLAAAVSAMGAQHEAGSDEFHAACVRVAEVEAENAHLKARVALLEAQAAKVTADVAPAQPVPPTKSEG